MKFQPAPLYRLILQFDRQLEPERMEQCGYASELRVALHCIPPATIGFKHTKRMSLDNRKRISPDFSGLIVLVRTVPDY